MWNAGNAAGPLGWGAEVWCGGVVVAAQVMALSFYLGARGRAPRARGRIAPIPLVALAFAAAQFHLGVPAPEIAPALVTVLCGGIALVGAGGADVRREWFVAGIALGLLAWSALGVAPLGAPEAGTGVDADFGLVFAALTGGAALAAHWPSLVAAFAEPGREPPLPWFLWSASHGAWVLFCIAAGMPWPFFAFPLVSQAATFGIGLFALDGRPAEVREGRGATRQGRARHLDRI
jgi:hypothetical protein